MSCLNSLFSGYVSPIRYYSCLFNVDKGIYHILFQNFHKVCASLNVEPLTSTTNSTNLGFGNSKEIMAAEANILVGTYNNIVAVVIARKEYLDMASAVRYCGNDSNEDWVNAVTQQDNILTHVSNVYHSVPQWMVLLLISVFFSNSGTKVNEATIKFARKSQHFSHPDEKQPATETMGVFALTSKETYRFPFEPVIPGVSFLEYCNIEATKEATQRGKKEASLRDTCDAAGALLVFDEVHHVSFSLPVAGLLFLLPPDSPIHIPIYCLLFCSKVYTHGPLIATRFLPQI
ncbi:hypothetical protein MKX01_008448 [Papaver californicum]|nr:hypothetical protein MKX01_008448 [Papaver californicum]